MPRRMKLPTREIGEIHVLAIDQRSDGTWEDEWEPLRGTRIGSQFTEASREALNHALYGLSRPLVDALGIPPEGALRKLLPVQRECYRRRKCPFYDARQCFPTAAKMPWCYEPDGIENERERLTATKAIEEWRQGVYLVIVREFQDA